ncbi:MAG: hypothetical protein ACRDJF_07070 [Actinomycetota bacterium]
MDVTRLERPASGAEQASIAPGSIREPRGPQELVTGRREVAESR